MGLHGISMSEYHGPLITKLGQQKTIILDFENMGWIAGILTQAQTMEMLYLKDEDESVSQALSCDDDDL